MATHNVDKTSLLSNMSRETAEKLSSSLPVSITAEDVEKYPKLANVLKKISDRVKDTGVSEGANIELTEAKKLLVTQKMSWLRVHTLYTELKNLLLDHEIQAVQTPDTEHKQFYKVVRDCISIAEAGDYLYCNNLPGSEVALLDLQKEDLDKFHPHKKHLPAIQQHLIPELEERLNTICEAITTFHHAATDEDEDELQYTFAEALKLPSLLKDEQSKLKDLKQQQKQEKLKRIKHTNNYSKALQDCFIILNTLIEVHCLGSQKESDEIACKWLGARCQAMLLKMKLIEMQLLCDTYNSRTVPALSVIRQNLDQAVEKKASELTQVNHSLAAFEACGLGFDDLVRQYTFLREEIDNKNWAIKELKESYDEEDD